jgi:hypothetical protein
MRFKVLGFHCGDYEEYRLLGCYTAWLLQKPTFRTNVAPPSSPIFVTLMMETLLSFETSILARAKRRNIPEDGIHLNEVVCEQTSSKKYSDATAE